jgi:hypothetical protein
MCYCYITPHRILLCPECKLPSIPDTVQYLYAYDNKHIKSLTTLPKNLLVLCIKNTNNISKLPKLPDTIFDLDIDGTNIHEIDKFPDSLLFFSANNTSLKKLPHIHENIRYISCENTNIKKFKAPGSVINIHL